MRLIDFSLQNRKKVVILNATFYNNTDDAFCVLNRCHKIFVREEKSKEILDSQGITSEVVPDLIFDSHIDARCLDRRRDVVGISDSVFKDLSIFFLEYVTKKEKMTFLPIGHTFFLNGVYSPRRIVLKLRDTMLHIPGIRLFFKNEYVYQSLPYKSKTEKELVKKICTTRGVVAGRFHLMCLCIMLEHPFMSISSNTHKMESLLSDIGILDRAKRVPVEISDLDVLIQNMSDFTSEEKKKISRFKIEAREKIKRMFDSLDKI
jgi:polysaccharide pyruvyl transferase WcaK-like protein